MDNKFEEYLDITIEMIRGMKEDQKIINREQSEIKEDINKISGENKMLAYENARLKHQYKDIREKIDIMERKVE